MDRYLPDVGIEDLDRLYADLEFPDPPARPHVYLDMVMTADGAASWRGTTDALGGPADRMAFRRLRETADVILVGAGTVRAEDYGPPRSQPGGPERRGERGQAERPLLAVVSASLDLDPRARLFSDHSYRPLVLTTADAPEAAMTRLDGIADVRALGRGRVDLGAAMATLWEDGHRRVLCEGGPRLNAALLRAGLVDELFLTVAPMLIGASPRRIVAGEIGPPRDLELVELRHLDGELLLRYRVTDPGARDRAE